MSKPLILIVDDDAVMRAVIAKHLESEGFESVQARDGEEGEAMLRERSFPVALIDIEMPRMDGLELLRRMRQVSPSTRSIITSGYVDLSRAMRAMRLGAMTIVTKPVYKDDLMAAVGRCLDDLAHWKQVLLRVQSLRGAESGDHA
jgi:DNA-binding NtrC family response regulator